MWLNFEKKLVESLGLRGLREVLRHVLHVKRYQNEIDKIAIFIG